MIEEHFIKGNSLMHSIDPRFRVIFATLFAFVIALCTKFSTLIAALLFAMVLISFVSISPIRIIRKLTSIWYFLLLLWFLLPLTFEGEPLFVLGPLEFSKDGVILASQITFKSNIILISFIAMILTMDLVTLGHSLDRLKVPEKLVHLLLFTYRYIFVIEQEYMRLIRAAKIRNFRPKTNMHTYKTYAYIMGMLFVRASKRAQRVDQAMRCRGFRGKFYSLKKFSVSKKEWIWSTFMVFGITGLVLLEWACTMGYI